MKKIITTIITGVLLFSSISPAFSYYTGMPASFTVGGLGTTANTLSFSSAAITIGNKFVVSDGNNNRVLIYNSIPTTDGASADVVIGQADFTHGSFWGGGSVGAGNFLNPRGISSDGTRLFVADASDNRVLIWNTIPTSNNVPADVVVGQPNFTTVSATPVSASKFSTTFDVEYDPSTGKLIIIDGGNSRVLIYNQVPTTNGAAADVVIGQTNFSNNSSNQGGTAAANTLAANVRSARVINGKLFIADTSNNRVLIYNSIPTNNNATADVVIGQQVMTTTTAAVTATNLSSPGDMILLNNQRLVIPDIGNARVLIYNSIPTANGASADVVIGQTDFTHAFTGTTVSKFGSSLRNISSFDNKLIIPDAGNNRVLIFNDVTTTPVINLTTPITNLNTGKYRLSGNIFMNTNNQTYGLQTIQTDLNGTGYGQLNFPSGRNDGSGNTIFDFNYDFDPTVGSGSINNVTIKLLASTFNADTNTLFYFLPFNFQSFNVSSTKSQNFTFSVNKDQLQRVKDNLDHFEVWYTKNTTTPKWTNYISNISKAQIDQNGTVVVTKTTNLTKFIGSYIFKITAIDNWGNKEDSNVLHIAGTGPVTKTTYPSFSNNFQTPFPTTTPVSYTTTAPNSSYVINPSVTPNLEIMDTNKNDFNEESKLKIIFAASLVLTILSLIIIVKRRKKNE